MIEIHDGKVPFHIQQQIYNFVRNSNFRIQGWFDRDDIEGDKQDLHSQWSLDDLKNSKLYSYVNEIQSFDKFEKCIVNLSKPGDYYYKHAHGEGSIAVVYYVNLIWREGWAGETIIGDKVFEFVPGRLLKFDGTIPHSIRPQSIIGPHYRFTISTFFRE